MGVTFYVNDLCCDCLLLNVFTKLFDFLLFSDLWMVLVFLFLEYSSSPVKRRESSRRFWTKLFFWNRMFSVIGYFSNGLSVWSDSSSTTSVLLVLFFFRLLDESKWLLPSWCGVFYWCRLFNSRSWISSSCKLEEETYSESTSTTC